MAAGLAFVPYNVTEASLFPQKVDHDYSADTATAEYSNNDHDWAAYGGNQSADRFTDLTQKGHDVTIEATPAK